jgi:hypothetical protein
MAVMVSATRTQVSGAGHDVGEPALVKNQDMVDAGGGGRVMGDHHHVCPSSSTARRSRPTIASEVYGSSVVAGSSAKITSGRVTRARAMATRCCPPESGDKGADDSGQAS